MPTDDNLAERLLANTADSIQSLHKLTTQIDERVTQLKERSEDLNTKIEEILNKYNTIIERIVVLEAKSSESSTADCHTQLIEHDKRLMAVEQSSQRSEGRWKTILMGVLQLVFIVIASWIIVQLGLTPPPLP